MERYKRNQIEEAISRILEAEAGAPSAALRTRLKRLLEVDRSLGRKVRSPDPEKANYAFFSDESPGRGVEIWFSDYEAFALLIALRLMRHGWPQSFPVEIMRRVRPELEKEHARILKHDPALLFDQDKIVNNVRPGDLYIGNTDPVYLVMASDLPSKDRVNAGMPKCSVCRGALALGTFVKEQAAQSWTTLELVNSAHQLAFHLKNSLPRKRGRGN